MDRERSNDVASQERWNQVVQTPTTIHEDARGRQFRVLRVVDDKEKLIRLAWAITIVRDGKVEVGEYGEANLRSPNPEGFVNGFRASLGFVDPLLKPKILPS